VLIICSDNLINSHHKVGGKLPMAHLFGFRLGQVFVTSWSIFFC